MTILKKPRSYSIGKRVSHAIKPIVVTLYPNGVIGLREKGRRKEVTVEAGRLYVNLIAGDIRERKRERRRKSSK